MEQGAVVFQRAQDAETTRLKREVGRLEDKLTKKNEVLGQLMGEYVALRKELGAS